MAEKFAEKRFLHSPEGMINQSLVEIFDNCSMSDDQLTVCIRLTSLVFSFPGVAWSFRFASLKKKMVITNLPHLDIREWLQRLDLLDYEDNFRKFLGVEDLINLSESDIKELGVKHSSHRARMVSSLVALKGEKIYQNDSREFEYFSMNILAQAQEYLKTESSLYLLASLH